MMTTVTIEGLGTLLNRLEVIGSQGKVRIARAAIRGAMNVQGRAIRKQTSKKVANVRVAVKGRLIKKRGEVAGKVGFGVGKKGTRRSGEKEGPRPAGRGVGISGRNIYWWVLGTSSRSTRAHATGRMPAMQPGLAAIAYAQAAGKINAEMIKRGALQLKKEIKKLQGIK